MWKLSKNICNKWKRHKIPFQAKYYFKYMLLNFKLKMFRDILLVLYGEIKGQDHLS